MIATKSNIDRMIKRLAAYNKQWPFAISKAINDTAYAVKKDVDAEMLRRFDRPTPYTLKAIGVDKSDKRDLVAYVGLRDYAPSKGTNYQDALAHHFVGGARVKKKSEFSLVRKGQFQGGKSFLGIGSGAAVDQYGNLSRSMIVELMSYFNAFSEVGYKANKTDKQRQAMSKGTAGGYKKVFVGPTASPYKTIRGVVYFMSRGRGQFVGQGKGWTGGRNQPLGAGIYSKTGTHGAVVKPILMAIKSPTYKRLIDMPAIVKNTVQRDFKKNFAAAYEYAMRTAR